MAHIKKDAEANDLAHQGLLLALDSLRCLYELLCDYRIYLHAPDVLSHDVCSGSHRVCRLLLLLLLLFLFLLLR